MSLMRRPKLFQLCMCSIKVMFCLIQKAATAMARIICCCLEMASSAVIPKTLPVSKKCHEYNKSHPAQKDKDGLVCLDDTINHLQGTNKFLVSIFVGNPRHENNGKERETCLDNGSRYEWLLRAAHERHPWSM
jgi:hypothetical protein